MSDRDRLEKLYEKAVAEYSKTNKAMFKKSFICDFLIENGVIVPPCELNDLVYVIPCRENGLKEIAEMRCIGFAISRDEKILNLVDWKNKLYQPYFSRFGIDIFSSRKEAEKAFVERRENEQRETD